MLQIDDATVEIVIVNYRTPDLVISLYNSIRRFIYEDVHIRIIDNGTIEAEFDQLYKLEAGDINKVTIESFNKNLGHGPSMDYAIKTSRFAYQLILDSDTAIIKEGLLEYFDSQPINSIKDFYGMGLVVQVNKTGNNVSHNEISYLHPHCMLINKIEYLKYQPFISHGAPCIKTMTELHTKNVANKLISIPQSIMSSYVKHLARGTRNTLKGLKLRTDYGE